MKAAKATFRDGRSRSKRGFSLLELLIVVAIVGLLALISIPLAGKIIRRTQDLAGYSSIKQTLASARLQAVKRQANVVVVVSIANPSQRIRLLTFQDRAKHAGLPRKLAAELDARESGFPRLRQAHLERNVAPQLGHVVVGPRDRIDGETDGHRSYLNRTRYLE